MNLYQITEMYNHALGAMADMDEQTIADTMEGLEGDLEVKALNTAAYIANKRAEVSAIKDAAKKLSDRAAAEQKSIDRLTEYLRVNLEAAGKDGYKNSELVLKIKKNPPSVVIDDETAIPTKYVQEKIVKSIDKTAIKSALTAGDDVSGAHIEQKTRLEIK